MKRILALVLGLVMAMVLLPVLTACGTDDPAPPPTDPQTTQPALQGTPELDFDELIMATNAQFPPFEWFDDDGNIVGFDVDIANAIARRLGLTLRIEHMSFDAIITAVQTGPPNQIGVAAITITEERAQAVNFTVPYFETELVVIVTEDSDIQSLDDLEGRVVGVQLGTTSDIFVENSPLFDDEPIRLTSPPDLIPALNAGQVDLVIIDREVAMQFIDDNEGLRMLEEPVGQDIYGIIVQQGQDDLLAAINHALAEMKADGEYDRIFDDWFGGEEVNDNDGYEAANDNEAPANDENDEYAGDEEE